MLMRDPMHLIDHSVIVFLLRVIPSLWRYIEMVENVLQVLFNTASHKLMARLNMVLGPRVGENWQVMKGTHDTLISLSKTTRSAFDELGKDVHNVSKTHCRPRPKLDIDLTPAYLSPGNSEAGAGPVG